MKLPLPGDTRSVFKDNNVLFKTSNLGLLFNKYVNSWQNGWQMTEEDSKKFRQSVSDIKFSKEYIENVLKRQQMMINNLKDSGWHVEFFTAKTDSRLIIGLGGTSVIETGMTLHPLYGFPYLPGSGLKGLARGYAEIGVESKPSADELREVFGSEKKDAPAVNNIQGKVFFMDGLPATFPKLDLDIMNPHYGEYYRGGKPPADYLNPVPVTFLTVASEQPFLFAVFSRDKALSEKAKQWLTGGLTDLGAGGKTNVGYGYFKIDVTLQTQSQPGIAKVTKASPMDALLERVKQCRQPGDKHILQKVFDDAWKIEGLDRKELLGQIRLQLPDTMKKNDKIISFLKEKEKESGITN
ncbi:MAG: type III-B CRISPR module RAMP protein Cmr6 [Nitrospirae bacterium]|nr:type III-B CRISPR module RAMP protein Cmr6 [Nitrospirota bacterium]